LNRIVAQIKGLSQHQLTRNTSWLFSGQAFNFFFQAAFFILLARLLGATQYGIFAGVFALVNTVTPYCGLGSGLLFMRYVHADAANAPVYWGNGLLATAVMALIIAVAFIFIGPLTTGIHDVALTVYLVIAYCLLGRIVTLASFVFQTYEKMKLTAMLTTLANISRLLVLICMRTALHHATAAQWAVGVVTASAITAAIAIYLVHKSVGSPTFNVGLIFRRTWEGLGFSLAASTQAVYNDIDKAILSREGLIREDGFYTLAYRIIDFAATPGDAISASVLPRYFQLQNRGGPRPVVRLALKSILVMAGIGIVVAVILWFSAPIVPRLVGGDFGGVMHALRLLCVIPLLRGVHMVSGNALSATDNQKLRLVSQFSVAAINVGLNFWWIPLFGWVAAAWSSVVSDGLLAVISVSFLLWVGRRGVPPMGAPSPA
jgi:O-antigen/teichoic acid export membrane protein